MRREGYSTKIYNLILGFLSENCERSMTASDVYEYIHTSNETANKTTVYRNLDRLVGEGKLLKYVTDDGKMASYIVRHSEQNCVDHLHLQCSCCGKVIHLDCDYIDELISHISQEHDFDLCCGSSVLYGKCRECEEKKS